jgi:hypothetical protein
MPSAPSYKRNYKQERKTSQARGETKSHTLRLRARRLEVKKGAVSPHDGKDVDHKVPLSTGGVNTPGNLRVESSHKNRSYARTSSGAIKKKK